MINAVSSDARIDPDAPFIPQIDPAILRAARQIYDAYAASLHDRPLGVAVNRKHHRGKLIFSEKPILLPQECFVPFEIIRSTEF